MRRFEFPGLDSGEVAVAEGLLDAMRLHNAKDANPEPRDGAAAVKTGYAKFGPSAPK